MKLASAYGPTIHEVKRVGVSPTGFTAIKAVVSYGYAGDPDEYGVVFHGYPGETHSPVVMESPSGQVFVRDPERHGAFGVEWVRRFFATTVVFDTYTRWIKGEDFMDDYVSITRYHADEIRRLLVSLLREQERQIAHHQTHGQNTQRIEADRENTAFLAQMLYDVCSRERKD